VPVDGEPVEQGIRDYAADPVDGRQLFTRRGTDRVEQSGKDHFSIFQRGHFVAFQQGWSEQIPHRSNENIIPDCIVSDNFVVDLLFSREEITSDKEGCRSANGSCTKRRWPS